MPSSDKRGRRTGGGGAWRRRSGGNGSMAKWRCWYGTTVDDADILGESAIMLARQWRRPAAPGVGS